MQRSKRCRWRGLLDNLVGPGKNGGRERKAERL